MNLLEEIGIGSANDGEKMVINGTDGKPLADEQGQSPSIMVLGKDSDAFRDMEQELMLELLDKRADNEDYQPSKEESRNRTNRLLASCVASWENINANNQPVECTPEKALYLLNNSAELSEQLNRFIGNRANFLKK